MDITKTISLLQSQIQNKPANTLKNLTTPSEGQAEEPTTATEAQNTETASPTTSQQQGSGQQFSTFLTLLTAQIKNQDPLAPLDSTQFVEQLATFTNLEFQATGNQSLERIATLLMRQIELHTPAKETGTTSKQTIDTAA